MFLQVREREREIIKSNKKLLLKTRILELKTLRKLEKNINSKKMFGFYFFKTENGKLGIRNWK